MTECVENVSLDILFGHVECFSRWQPCACADPWCGHFINWSVETDRQGNRTKKPEWIGVKTVCDKVQK